MSELQRPWQQIKWDKPLDFVTLAESPKVENSLQGAIDEVGNPHVAGTPLEEAWVLLAAAAEVEHSLLVQYLYASISLGANPAAQQVRSIAIQEMCHFVTVQNLLLFAGAHVLLQREDQDPHPDTDPFPFSLRPLTKESLEDYLLAEMPPLETMTKSQSSVMKPILDSRKQPVHPVGLIYARLYWLFQKDDHPTVEWPEVAKLGFTPGRHVQNLPADSRAATFQIDPVAEKQWHGSADHGGIFLTIPSRESALSAIAAIAKQGEGLIVSSGDQSHFEVFLEIHANTDFSALPVVKMPTDPFVASQPATDPAKEANRITNKIAAALCAVFDTRYQIMLAAIRGALSRSRAVPADASIRVNYANWALQEMISNVNGLSRAILRLAAKDGGNVAQLAASPPFTLGNFSLPDDPATIDGVLLDLHKASKAKVSAALATNPDALSKFVLQQIQQIDQGRFPNL